MKLMSVIVIFFLTIILSFSSIFVVYEGRQAIITEFGRPVGEPYQKPGLYFKKPFIQDVRLVESRILSWDGYPNQIPTQDKKYISVDTTARWKVTDPLKFIQSVQSEQLAKARIDSILDANTRDIISKHRLVEAVRNTNHVIDRVEEIKQGNTKPIVDGVPAEDEVSGDIEKVYVGREKLSEMIAANSTKELADFGIEIIDVQLRRISYEKSVEQKVHERMISERQRIAEKIRSIGKGEKAKIEGRLSKDLQEIESIAYRTAQKIKGEAEAKAVKIYAQAFKKDPVFFEFMKSMEAYKEAIKPDTKMILTDKNNFLKYLK
jgi:modulator of FtsH protease HflC